MRGIRPEDLLACSVARDLVLAAARKDAAKDEHPGSVRNMFGLRWFIFRWVSMVFDHRRHHHRHGHRRHSRRLRSSLSGSSHHRRRLRTPKWCSRVVDVVDFVVVIVLVGIATWLSMLLN